MEINGIPISKFGAKLHANYSVSGSAISSTYLKPKKGSTFHVINREIGIKTLTIPFDIYGDSPVKVKRSLSKLDALASSGKVELALPDGFLYTAILQSIAQPTYITDCILSCSYTFVGIQHESKIRMDTDNGYIWVSGTMPQMDCILTTTVGASVASYNFAGVTFKNVAKNDVLVLDGITKRVLVNGAPAAQKCDLIEFPYLVPGSNHFVCTDPVTVQYYPAYL